MSSRRGRFRTKLCRNFALGHCPQGDSCNYIHATPESIQSDGGIQGMVGDASSPGYQSLSGRTTIASPVWSTLSPATVSSDQPNYQLSTSMASGTTPASKMKYRPLSWRTALCRHFVRNKGWCPLGERCNYIHDLALAEAARDDVRFNARHSLGSATGRQPRSGKAGSKHSHCWAYVQGLCHVQDCQYLHPVAVHLFAQHTPCLAWPNCRRGPLCPYKHPEAYVSNTPPDSPSLAPADARPPQAVEAEAVPRGAVPYNGTIYFNLQSPPQPPQPPQMLARPLALNIPPPQPPQPQMMLTNPWDAWHVQYPPTTPMTYLPVMVGSPTWQGTRTGWLDTHNPSPSSFVPPPMSRFQGPPFGNPVPAFPFVEHEPGPLPPAQSDFDFNSNYTYQRSSGHATGHVREGSLPTPDEELPYVPPKHPQVVGHARRVSVTIKSREDLDALALDSDSVGTRGRQPWQTHGDRLGRRSWAPSSSSLHVGGAMTPPPALYGM